ncbi:MAG: DNA repair protein RadA [Candidatus Uhrbacteria bacterium]
MKSIKIQTIYTCSKCDAQHVKWLGQCTECGGWGTLTEASASNVAHASANRARAATIDAPLLSDVRREERTHVPTSVAEFDVAIGGGIVPGSLLLLAGEPGIGKSTLLLQVASAVGDREPVLYITGEETASQVKQRADRLGASAKHLRLLATTDAHAATAAITKYKPTLAIVDSVQTIAVPDLPVDAGGITQVRTLTNLLLHTAKTTNIPIIIVGHVTKDGGIAGPKMLEHIVDQVAMIEGDTASGLRILRTTKNRFGPTDVVGVFEMNECGLQGCADPSAAFLGATHEQHPGSAVTAMTLGSRTLLVEVQALVSRTAFGNPQRRAIGLDVNRLHVLLAILAQHAHISCSSADVHVATIGGIRIDDRAADLAIAAAIATAIIGMTPPIDAWLGELGLTGAIRPVRTIERRVQELVRLGRKRIVVPPGTKRVPGAQYTELREIHELGGLLKERHT